LRVVGCVDESRGEILWHAAQKLGIALAAEWKGNGFDLYGVNPAFSNMPTFVSQDEAVAYLSHARVVGRRTDGIDARSDFLGQTHGNTLVNAQSEEKYGLRG